MNLRSSCCGPFFLCPPPLPPQNPNRSIFVFHHSRNAHAAPFLSLSRTAAALNVHLSTTSKLPSPSHPHSHAPFLFPRPFDPGVRETFLPTSGHAQDLQLYGPGPSWLGANDADLWNVQTTHRHDLSPATRCAPHDAADQHRSDRQPVLQRPLLLHVGWSRRRGRLTRQSQRLAALDFPRRHSRGYSGAPATSTHQQCRRSTEVMPANYRKQRGSYRSHADVLRAQGGAFATTATKRLGDQCLCDR